MNDPSGTKGQSEADKKEERKWQSNYLHRPHALSNARKGSAPSQGSKGGAGKLPSAVPRASSPGDPQGNGDHSQPGRTTGDPNGTNLTGTGVQKSGGTGSGGQGGTASQAKTELDYATMLAGIFNLEFGADKNGVTSGGIPGGHGPDENASQAGQSAYVAMAVFDAISVAKSLWKLGKSIFGHVSETIGGRIAGDRALQKGLEELLQQEAKLVAKKEAEALLAKKAVLNIGGEVADTVAGDIVINPGRQAMPIDKLRSLLPNNQIIEAGAEKIPLDDGVAKLVKGNKLPNSIDWTKAATEFNRVLAPGGALDIKVYGSAEALASALRASGFTNVTVTSGVWVTAIKPF